MTLRTKISYPVGCIIFIAMSISTIMHVRYIQQDYKNSMYLRSEALAQGVLDDVLKRISSRVFSDEASIDREQLDAVMRVSTMACSRIYELNKNKDVAFIAVINSNGIIAAHNDHQQWDRSIKEPALLTVLQNHAPATVLVDTTYHALVPILNDQDIYFGAVVVGYPKEVVDKKIKQAVVGAIRSLVFSLLLSYTGISVLVHLVVTKPVGQLVKVSQEIARGDIEHSMLTQYRKELPKKQSSKDEIKVLTTTFHEMTKYLHEVAQAATQIATGDLSSNVHLRSERDVLGHAFNNMSLYLKQLAEASGIIADGNLQHRIQVQSEHDVLGNAFRAMAVKLRENFEKIQQEVAERTRAQVALQQLNNELEQRVEERTARLATANEEIRNLNEQLQQENLRMSSELEVSRRIQQMVLPPASELEEIADLDIVGYMQPADEVGGDYYDVVCHNGTIHIGIGDVTGHGLESGILMLMTQTAVRTMIEHGETNPAAFLSTLNRVILKNAQRMKADKMLTFAFVTYHDGVLDIVGQHEEVLVARQGGMVERIDTIDLGFPLGLEDNIDQFIAEATISLQPGEAVILYTDGITEAENAVQEFYGVERLCQVLNRAWEKPAGEIKQAVIEDVTRHIGQEKVLDDLTLVVMKQK